MWVTPSGNFPELKAQRWQSWGQKRSPRAHQLDISFHRKNLNIPKLLEFTSQILFIPPFRLPIMPWIQREIELKAQPRGFHLITREIVAALPEIADIKVGLLHLFLKHTSAALTINENADADVPLDLESSFSALAPESFPHRHTCEGPDDMPAHVKASMIGCAQSIPITNGQLNLGTWQGIYLCEHRNHGGKRKVVATIWGE